MLSEAEPPWRRERRDRILQAAAGLFASQPYQQVQMDELARAAGMGKATLYRYFPSKHSLFIETFELALTDLQDRLNQDAARHQNPERALAEAIAVLVGTLSGPLPVLKALGAEQADAAELARAAFRRRIQGIRQVLAAILARGIEAGCFRPLDLAVAPQMLIGMVRGAIGTGRPAEELSQTLTEFIRHALAPAPAVPGRPESEP